MLKRLAILLALACGLIAHADAQTYQSNIRITPTQGTTGLSVLETTDTSWSSFGTPTAIIGTQGVQNNLVGFLLNNAAPSTNALPVATAGYAKVSTNGNQAFGVYGLGELTATGGGVAIGSELTCRNNSGNAPDTALPPNEAIGTATSVCNGLQITAGGGNNSSIGLSFSSEAGSTKVFNTGIYLSPSSHAQFGIFVDAQTSGTQTSGVLQNNGNGINLQLGFTTNVNGLNTVFTVLNASSQSVFNLRQNGSGLFNQQTAPPAGGAATTGLMLSSTSGLGIYFGSGVPTVSAAQGSIYLRTDGTQNNRLYINTNGTTGWTAFATTS